MLEALDDVRNRAGISVAGDSRSSPRKGKRSIHGTKASCRNLEEHPGISGRSDEKARPGAIALLRELSHRRDHSWGGLLTSSMARSLARCSSNSSSSRMTDSVSEPVPGIALRIPPAILVGEGRA